MITACYDNFIRLWYEWVPEFHADSNDIIFFHKSSKLAEWRGDKNGSKYFFSENRNISADIDREFHADSNDIIFFHKSSKLAEWGGDKNGSK